MTDHRTMDTNVIANGKRGRVMAALRRPTSAEGEKPGSNILQQND
jgi:hypothetical protein